MTDQAKRTEYMRKWRKRNRKKYNDYQREYMRQRRKACQQSGKGG